MWKSFFSIAAAALTLSLSAAAVDVVLSVNGAKLNTHPQVIELRKSLNAKALAAGDKTLDQTLADAHIDKAALECRYSFYFDSVGRQGVVVVDTPEGKAPVLFDSFCKLAGFKDGGTKRTIDGCKACSGVISDGSQTVILLRSVSQLQIQLGDTLTVPLDLSAIDKGLRAAADNGRLVNLAFIPPESMRNDPNAAPIVKTLQVLTLGISDTRPEAELVLDGSFSDPQAAQAGKGMLDMMLIMFQQNPSIDPRLFQNIQSSVTGGKVSCKRLIDKGFIDAVIHSAGAYGVKVPGAPAAVPVSIPAPAPAASAQGHGDDTVSGTTTK